MAVNPIREGHSSLTPYLIVRGGAAAIEFYKQAFGAEEMTRMPMPNGAIMHACLKIGNSTLMLSDEFPQSKYGVSPQTANNTTALTHLIVPDVDAVVAKAVKAGAKVKLPISDMFWGDRYGQIIDPFGHVWSVATHKEDLTPQQIQERAKAAMANMCKE